MAPAFSWEISKNTKITFLFEYQNYQYGFDRVFRPEREFFQIPISRFLGEPDFNNATANSGRASYILEHQFSDNWKLRHAFAAVLSSNDPKTTYPDGLQDDRRTLNRSASRSEESSSNYTIGCSQCPDHRSILPYQARRYFMVKQKTALLCGNCCILYPIATTSNATKSYKSVRNSDTAKTISRR
ncbi:hypothetical protein [Nostoc sp. ChiQUE01b]|uniref:hypothetical protein n=1 Tax=Nostoc sp. ChiQUE01b TaxID=3075376 RepID=UPI002AD2B5F2|nr:hypothetical protein [Nostoc sp. ChiQUE01b]MDZ8261519.1 hypothetical protein [Nostoc sp. ChiQUE01b]